MTHPDVLIVGGGIGGLATAFALRRRGYPVQVLEQAPEFGEVGAGLQLAPNATRILKRWGLLDQVIEAGVLPRRLVMRDALTDEKLTHLDLGEGFRRRYEAPYVVLHRSDLHAILADACRDAGVDMRTGCHIERVDASGELAVAYGEDGSAYESSVVLGMDGLMSTLRGTVVRDQPVASGYVAYRGAVPAEDVSVDISSDEVVLWIGPGCHLVQYPVRRGEVVNQVAVFRSPAFDRGSEEWGGVEELDAAFSDCCGHVRGSLALLWRDRNWKMYDRLPVDDWVNGRLGLLGDAAHPMLQYLAQGACQALEDADAIAETAHAQSAGHREVDWPAVLVATQESRSPRTARVQTTARTWGEIWHVDGVARLLRNELLRTRDVDDYQHIDWLYG